VLGKGVQRIELERAFETKFTEDLLKDSGDGVPSDGSRRSSS